MKKRAVFALLLALCGMAAFAQNIPRVVVLPLENRAGERHEKDVETLTELLSAFINETRRINVIDRLALNTAIAARRWRADDWDNISKTAELGKALNASYILRGAVLLAGDNLLVSVRILDINTVEVKAFTNMQLEHMNEAYSKMNSLAQLLVYTLEIPVQPEPEPPSVAQAETPPPVPAETPAEPAQPSQPAHTSASDPARLNTLGASAGTAFVGPLFVATVQGTFAPLKNSFLELGMDVGFGIVTKDTDYFSLYPYVRYALFLPFAAGGGFYTGAGAGVMVSHVTFSDAGKIIGKTIAAEASAGVIFRSGLTVSYTVRTEFTTANHKLAVGYSYRFK